MEIKVLVSNSDLCCAIEGQRLSGVLEIFDDLEEFSDTYIFPEEGLETLFMLLHRNRRNEECAELSRKLERGSVKGRKRIIYDSSRYQKERSEVELLNQEESDSFEDILKEHGYFNFGDYRLCYGCERPLRSIENGETLEKALILFGISMAGEKEFTEYIKKVYQGLIFDSDLSGSLRRLEAGLAVRKKEILYHLYCIEKEIPEILEHTQMMDNQALGKAMSIPCSPERSRALVEAELTKTADNGEIVCEMHTKMRQIGKNHKPDRIYFCPKVPDGIRMDGKKLEGVIYIYKITEHSGGKK